MERGIESGIATIVASKRLNTPTPRKEFVKEYGLLQVHLNALSPVIA